MSNRISTNAYAIRYYQGAKTEVEKSIYLGPTFTAPFYQSLDEIAAEAAAGNTTDSVNLIELCDDILKNVLQQEYFSAIKRLISAFSKKASNDREIRCQTRSIHNVLGVCSLEIDYFYEIDHMNKQVIFTHFSGLPGSID
jgi:hypothetical protein